MCIYFLTPHTALRKAMEKFFQQNLSGELALFNPQDKRKKLIFNVHFFCCSYIVLKIL